MIIRSQSLQTGGLDRGPWAKSRLHISNDRICLMLLNNFSVRIRLKKVNMKAYTVLEAPQTERDRDRAHLQFNESIIRI